MGLTGPKWGRAVAGARLFPFLFLVSSRLLSFPVTFLLVLLQHRAGRDFLRSFSVAPRSLSALLDVLVLPLFLLAHAAKVFLLRPCLFLGQGFLSFAS